MSPWSQRVSVVDRRKSVLLRAVQSIHWPSLARAWALQPDVLFLDEPTASLDPSAKREVEQLIADLATDCEVILIDYAPEVDHFVSDITRTWPVAGTFTARQAELYDAVLASQAARLVLAAVECAAMCQ